MACQSEVMASESRRRLTAPSLHSGFVDSIAKRLIAMNRLFLCIILLLGSQAAHAEKLYRWIEADGSITFSPTPPAKGVEYKTVEGSGSNVASPASATIEESDKKSIMATSEHAVAPPQPDANLTTTIARPANALPKQRLTYAPETGSKRIITGQTPVLTTPETQNTSTQPLASSNKRQQCQALSKRVVSLERRLSSPLTPEDMDNTVIAMARYQRSFDQYCVN